MRIAALILGWALAVTAGGLLAAGLSAAAPGTPPMGASALGQVVAQQWDLSRGFQHMLLAGVVLLCALAAFILARLTPGADAQQAGDVHSNIARMASALEALRREGQRRD